MASIGSNAEDRILAGMSNLDTRLKALEQQGARTELILLRLDHLADELAEVKAGVDKINSRVGKVENGQGQHEVRVTVLETFCQDQVKPALGLVTDNRLAIAGMIAKYGAGGFGVVSGLGAIVFAVGKAAGWW